MIKIKIPQWVEKCCKVLEIGGAFHDIGKATLHFKGKLGISQKKKVWKDPLRHEYISRLKINDFRLTESAKIDNVIIPKTDKPDTPSEWRDLWDVILFIVSTHHRLYGSESIKGAFFPTWGEHFDSDKCDRLKIPSKHQFISGFNADVLEKMLAAFRERNQGEVFGEKSLRAFALITRAALIAADHKISSLRPEECRIVTHTQFGISIKREKNMAMANQFQSLDWHHKNVPECAKKICIAMACEKMRGISVEHIKKSRSEWKKILQKLPATAPTLAFVHANTGNKNSKFCINLACALRRNDENIRISTALNLRTLTTQTYENYLKELKIPKNDLAIMLGTDGKDQFKSWGNYVVESFANVDGSPLHELFPHEKAVRLLESPVTVSTMDFLAAAGDMSNHRFNGAAFFRVATSDLIIDEIDSYDPPAIVAICRMIEIAALFGRNVIVSSTMLYQAVADAIGNACRSGWEMRQEISVRKPDFQTVFINYEKKLEICDGKNGFDFGSKVAARRITKKSRNRVIHLSKLKSTSVSNWLENAVKEAKSLHKSHRFELHEKRVSFGLIRLNHVEKVSALARHIIESEPNVHVCLYHGGDLHASREHKEKMLRILLDRKNGNTNIENDDGIKKRLKKSKNKDVMFLVLATSAIEYAKEYDFDYAVIEPASAHSIIKCTEMVNHRNTNALGNPNVIVMRQNMKMFDSPEGILNWFAKPGFQFSDIDYTQKPNVSKLLTSKKFPADEALERGFVKLAELDEKCIQMAIEPLSHYLNNGACFVVKDWYKKFSLRSNSEQRNLYQIDKTDLGKILVSEVCGEKLEKCAEIEILNQSIPKNLWLQIPLKEILREKTDVDRRFLRAKIDGYKLFF